MTLVRTYVIPHGDEILSLPNKESKTMNRAITKGTGGDKSDTILIISPHSLMIPSGIPVMNTRYLTGVCKVGNRTIRGKYETNRGLNSDLIRSSKYFLETNFVTADGKLSNFPMDFGTLIPLRFFKKKKISMLGQWRTPKRGVLIDLGKRLFDVVSHSDEMISVIFSADQAHAHLKTGPYGFDPRARKYDDLVIESIKANNFEKLIKLSDAFISGAKPDSYWNILMFHGFTTRGNIQPEFYYYYLQKYFGMLFAVAE